MSERKERTNPDEINKRHVNGYQMDRNQISMAKHLSLGDLFAARDVSQHNEANYIDDEESEADRGH